MCGSGGELEGLDLEEYMSRGDNDEYNDWVNGIKRKDQLSCA
jgi:hypothetical protein